MDKKTYRVVFILNGSMTSQLFEAIDRKDALRQFDDYVERVDYSIEYVNVNEVIEDYRA